MNVGLLYIVSVASVGVYGIILAGYASNSKYPLLASLRASAQLISYEVAVTREPLAFYRLHPGAMSSNRLSRSDANLAAYQRLLARGALSARQRRRWPSSTPMTCWSQAATLALGNP